MKLETLCISWLPVVKVKGGPNLGGQRKDEHPMRKTAIVEVFQVKGESWSRLTVKTKQEQGKMKEREWHLIVDDSATCDMLETGLKALATTLA